MHSYASTLAVATYCLVGVCFYLLLGHFPVVSTCYHAQSGSELGMYGTFLQSKQQIFIQMRSQRVIVPNQNDRYIGCDKMGD